MNEHNSHCEGFFVVTIRDFTEIVTFGEFAKHPGTQVFLGWNDKVGAPGSNLSESGAGIKARIQQKQIALLEVAQEFLNQFVFRGAHLAINEAQGCACDKVKEAAKFDRDRSQSTRSLVCAEAFKKRSKFV